MVGLTTSTPTTLLIATEIVPDPSFSVIVLLSFQAQALKRGCRSRPLHLKFSILSFECKK